MRLKRIASSMVVALLLFSMFGVMLAYAPPPSPMPTIPVESKVFVTNEAIDVTLDEPIEVEGTVGIDDSDPVDVEIANAEGLPLDVSGWKHTTTSASFFNDEAYGPQDARKLADIDTAGYRLLTIQIVCYKSANYNIHFKLIQRLVSDGFPNTVEEFYIIDGATDYHATVTSEISAYEYEIWIFPSVLSETIEIGDLEIAYFLTT